ncbi:MAG: hypothetical protein AB1782_14335 [Cyanobacteriota bacterium]
MQYDDKYTLIMLDLNSPKNEVKLEALKKIYELENKIKYLPTLKKLSNSKDNQIKSEAIKILKSLGNYNLLSGKKINKKPVLDMLIESLPEADFKKYEPYLLDFENPDTKKPHIPSFVREDIQLYSRNENPNKKIIAMYLIILLPLEFKFKVSILVDLLRDSTFIVVLNTLNLLEYVDNDVAKKVIPIIIDMFEDNKEYLTEALCEYLKSLDYNTFKEEIKDVHTIGITPKTKKSISNKLHKILGE